MIEGRADICASDNMNVILVFRQLRLIDSEDNHCWLLEACQLYQYT
jgi:hypothetical protein